MCFAWFSPAALAAAPSPHDGEVERDTPAPREAPDDHPLGTVHPNTIAVRLLAANVIHDRHTTGRWGVGVVYERSIVHDWFDVEVGGAGLFRDDEGALELDLLVKKPTRLGDHWEFHAGLGGTVAWVWPLGVRDADDAEPSGPTPWAGGVGTLGIFAWPAPRLGLLLELNGKVLGTRGDLEVEAELAAGIATRF